MTFVTAVRRAAQVDDGIVRRAVAVITAGALLGTTYVLSPLTVWFALAMLGLGGYAAHGLSGRERRWVLGLFGAAVLLRVLAIAALFLSYDGDTQYRYSFFFDGDGAAMKLRSAWIESFWAGRLDPMWARGAFDDAYGWTSYLYVIAYIQHVLGPAPFGLHLVNVAFFLAGATVMFRFVRGAYGRVAALLGFAILLFLPTWFLWSVSALKESFQFFLMAVTLVTATIALGPGSARRRLLAGVVSMTTLAAASTVRTGLVELTVATLGVAVIASFIVRRRYLLIASPLLVVVAVAAVLQQDAVEARIMTELQRAATIHIGHVRTEGNSYRTLDAKLYVIPTNGLGVTLDHGAAVRFTLRSLWSFVAVPLPWMMKSRAELIFLPAQLIWYGIWGLAAVGVLAGLRRHALLTLVIVAHVGLAAAIIGLNSGNIGTLVRHRDMIAPVIVWLAALGVVSIMRRLSPVGRPAAIVSCQPQTAAANRRHWSILTTAARSSFLIAWLHRLCDESLVCRQVVAFWTRRTPRIDEGVPSDADHRVTYRLRDLARTSRWCRVNGRWHNVWTVGCRHAQAATVFTKHLPAMRLPERVRMLGWIVAVAVAVEVSIDAFGGETARASAFPVRLFFLLLAVVFISSGDTVATAWRDWMRRQSTPRQVGGPPSAPGELEWT